MIDKNSTYLFCFMSIYFISCGNQTKIEDPSISAILERITVDHVVKKREGCRFSTFYFQLLMSNKKNEEQQILLTSSPAHCKRSINESKIWWVKGQDSLPLTLTSSVSNEVISIQAQEKKEINLKGIFKVQGRNLKQIKSNYKSWIDSGKIVYEGKMNISIRKSDDLEVALLLDDEHITPADSIAFNMAIPQPNLKIDSLMDIDKVSEEEPKLKPRL